MQTIRFKGYRGIYIVYYKNIRVSFLRKINKNKWNLVFVNPSFNWGDETFNSLKEAKRFIRIHLNKRHLEERHFIKLIGIGIIRLHREAFKNLDLVSQPEKDDVGN